MRNSIIFIIFFLIISWVFQYPPNFGGQDWPRIWNFTPVLQRAYAADKVIFLTDTASTTWTVPSDWNNSSNTIEVIGGGGAGADQPANGAGAGGGAGGTYVKSSGLSLPPGSAVGIHVGAGGTMASNAVGNPGGATWLCDSTSNCGGVASSSVVISADGGGGGQYAGGGSGGINNSLGTTINAGGNGGTGHTTGDTGGGGGGSGGPQGIGCNGGSTAASTGGGGGGGGGGGSCTSPATATTTIGTAGGAGYGGSGGGAGGNGAAGSNGTAAGGGGGGGTTANGGNGATSTAWTTAGPGGGGGGAGDSAAGGNGGLYGGGGGGGTSGANEAGAQGIIVITYTPSSIYEQSAYKWYANNNSSTVGAELTTGIQDASTTLAAAGSSFRLRLLLHNSGATSTATDAFKLQYASTTPGNCLPGSLSSLSFTDVTTSTGAIRYNDNALPVDGDLLGATSTDPTHGGDTIVNQTYEEHNNFTVTSTIGAGRDGKWDFSLIDFSAPVDTTYCFLAVRQNSTILNVTSTASKIPEIRTAASTNSAPTVASVVLNGGSAITLIPNVATSFNISYTITDTNGCADIDTNRATSTAFRSGVSATCAVPNPIKNDFNCYLYATRATSTCNVNSINVTDTVQIYYFAQATDASSSFASQTWRAFALATDLANATGSSSSTAELNTLVAIDVAPASIDYGTVSASSTSGSVNQTSTIKNAGNSTTTLKISGKALASGANSIATSSERYATSTFTVGGSEQQLSGTATDVSGFSIPAPPMGMWRETQALPNSLDIMGAAAYNGYIYSVGGAPDGTNPTSSVWYSPIAASGTLGSWTAATALPRAIKWMPAVAYGNYLYTIGGVDTDVSSSVYYASINTSTGALGSWLNATPLASGIRSGGGAAYNDYLYSVGGEISGAIATSTVRYAPINATGSIGSWTNTTALPGARSRFSALVSGGYIYALGGIDSSGAGTSSVAYAPLNANGTVGAWGITNIFPTSTQRFGAAVVSNMLYVAGGSAGGESTTTVIFAAQNASGTLGVWTQSNFSLPAAQVDQGFAADRGFMYQLGGSGNGTTITSTVLYAATVNRPLFWGISVPAGTATGTYTGQNTFTAVFSP